MKKWFKTVWTIIKGVADDLGSNNVMMMAAALAYYTLFSLPPILIIIISVVSLIFEEQSVRQEVFNQIGNLVGRDGAGQIETALANTGLFKASFWKTLISLVALVFTATTVFVTIQKSLNTIFRVKPKPKVGILKMLKDRARSFALIISIGFIMMVSLVVDAVLSAFGDVMSRRFPALEEGIGWASSTILPLVVITVLFGFLFRWLPDAKLKWKDVALGSIVTAVLFTIGKLTIGFYIGQSNIASAYDAAGSILVLMLWVFYSSAIFLIGAEFIYIYTQTFEHRIRPSGHAVRFVRKEIDMEQGEEEPEEKKKE